MERRKFITAVAALPLMVTLPKLVRARDKIASSINFKGVFTLKDRPDDELTIHLHLYNTDSVAAFMSDFQREEVGLCIGLNGDVKSTKFRIFKRTSQDVDFDNSSYFFHIYEAKGGDNLDNNYGMIQQKNGENMIKFGFHEDIDGSNGVSDGAVYLFDESDMPVIELEAETATNNTEATDTGTTTDSDDLDCFLTSACVFHKGLADDCYELQTLRQLRETAMRPIPEYDELISEYELIAPAMLKNIYRADNKHEILDCIYDQLVIPSILLIERNKPAEAIAYYANFVEMMKKEYL
ncbi:hypothetical protein H8B06_17140 [Sphingobacterium sp. DN00404]|uniref:DUF4476 domain-containing protein n=1 Tax=Sphingobacterium micropteri TaxID=2763501 RepID=A0ABR7YT75_9SPHI|nr:hypothetical protein [Sphingobacterium micropteri]MBD1434553.1 hypothetical protein [Sphingobacterium micropteri]